MFKRIGWLPGVMFAVLTATGAHAQVASAPQASEDAYIAVKPMIADAQRIVTPNGVDTIEALAIGGIDQWVSIRGVDRTNPIIIYVHGGPGAVEMGRSWPYRRGWEDHFTVVQWDQRGTGKTLRENETEAAAPPLSRELMAADLVELISIVRERLGQQRVIILGHSWGSVIGLDAALQRPDWVSAFVGVGPVLNMRANEEAGFARLMAIATYRQDTQAIAELSALAPYPGSGTISMDALGVQRKWVMRYGGLAAYRDNADFYFRAARLSSDYDLADRQAIDTGGLLSVSALLPELSRVDFTSVRSTPFPVLMFLGCHDITTPPQVAEAWMDAVQAPLKRIVWFEHSAHLAPHEEPGRFLTSLVEHVRPLAVAAATQTSNSVSPEEGSTSEARTACASG